MNTDYYRELIRPVFAGRKLILAMGVIAGMAKMTEQLIELGARDCLLVGASEGTGELPDRDSVAWVTAVDGRVPDFLTGIRKYEEALRDPPSRVIEAVEKFDPDCEALVLCSHVSDLDELLGRPRLGARKPAWAALEDKVVIDAFWERAGIECSPVEIVDVDDRDRCRRATRQFDRGAGVAWAGDAKEGFNGGAQYVRWIRSEGDLKEACSFFADHCDQIRIMPFLEGIPCSIHAMVFAEQTIAFRPVEMIVLRRPDQNRLLYAGTSTWWDPPAGDRTYMRRIAGRAGDQLRREVDYRGAFTIDGVLTDRGFLPTELNARSGGAFADLYAGDRRLPLGFLNTCVRQGIELEYRPAELEKVVVDLADGHRHGSGRTTVDRQFDSTRSHELILEPRVRLVEDGEEGQATLTVGPSEVGGFVRVRPKQDAVAPGTQLAPLVAEVFEFADANFDTGIGSVVAAGAQ